MRNVVITSDLHLSDRPQDLYRLELFPWLADLVSRYHANQLFILGDLTEQKDRHSAWLVNRIVKVLRDFPAKVTIIKGNHDYIDANTPFFAFLSDIENVEFVSKPCWRTVHFNYERVLLLPHTRTPEKDWAKYLDKLKPEAQILAHMTVKGALGENGQTLDGISYAELVARLSKNIISGDVHVAQTLGRVEYIGAPYDLKFGDQAMRSALVFDAEGKRSEHLFPAPRKHVIHVTGTEVDAKLFKRVKARDQVQIVVELSIEDASQIDAVRAKASEIVTKRKAEVANLQVLLGVTAGDAERASGVVADVQTVFEQFVTEHKLAENVVEAGRECLRQVTK